MRDTQAWLRGHGLVWLLLGLLLACGGQPKPVYQVYAGQRILAFGDSLTQGVGARPAEAYPQRLAALTGWEVINAGVSGETTAEGLERLPLTLDETDPDLVLLCLGGNDMLRKWPSSKTRSNLRKLVGIIRASGAQPILIGVPEPALLGLSDHELYSELADELDVPLIQGVMSSTLKESKWRSDRIHPNADGYERIAGLVAAALGHR